MRYELQIIGVFEFMPEKAEFRYKLLLAALLKTRMTRTQARRLLGVSYRFWRDVISRLLREGIVEEKRYSVVTILQLTEKGREYAQRVAGDVEPTPFLREIGALTEQWFTLPELASELGVSPSELQKTLKRLGLGYRLIGRGVFTRDAEVQVRYRLWAVPASEAEVLKKEFAA